MVFAFSFKVELRLFYLLVDQLFNAYGEHFSKQLPSDKPRQYTATLELIWTLFLVT